MHADPSELFLGVPRLRPDSEDAFWVIYRRGGIDLVQSKLLNGEASLLDIDQDGNTLLQVSPTEVLKLGMLNQRTDSSPGRPFQRRCIFAARWCCIFSRELCGGVKELKPTSTVFRLNKA